ncbi:MAG TPA: hypothetical protein VFG24_02020 [Nitrosopumilaceae archaeon]|nr:hypothetical protein [Nitrosopumilaceae archaeon]
MNTFMIDLHKSGMTKVMDLYHMIYESNLESKLEQILVGLTKDNQSPEIEEAIRKFLLFVQHASENFWETFHNAKTYQERLECYYQFSKNQCLATEVLIGDLDSVSSELDIKENLSSMLKEGFTF